MINLLKSLTVAIMTMVPVIAWIQELNRHVLNRHLFCHEKTCTLGVKRKRRPPTEDTVVDSCESNRPEVMFSAIDYIVRYHNAKPDEEITLLMASVAYLVAFKFHVDHRDLKLWQFTRMCSEKVHVTRENMEAAEATLLCGIQYELARKTVFDELQERMHERFHPPVTRCEMDNAVNAILCSFMTDETMIQQRSDDLKNVVTVVVFNLKQMR